MDIKKKKNKRRKKRIVNYEQDRTEGSPPRPEEKWIADINSPSNQSGIPAGLSGMSSDPENTIAWIGKNCKFARIKQNEIFDE